MKKIETKIGYEDPKIVVSISMDRGDYEVFESECHNNHESMIEDAYQSSKMEQTDNTEDQGIYEESEKTVYEDDQVYCIEQYDYWCDPRAPYPIIEMEHHSATDRVIRLYLHRVELQSRDMKSRRIGKYFMILI